MSTVTRHRLTHKQFFTLNKWIKENENEIVAHRWTQAEAAKRAQRALGFTVTASSVKTAWTGILEKPWPQGTPSGNKTNPAHVVGLARAVAALYDDFDKPVPDVVKEIIGAETESVPD